MGNRDTLPARPPAPASQDAPPATGLTETGEFPAESAEVEPFECRTTASSVAPAEIRADQVACLVVLSGPSEGEIFTLEEGRGYVIGRADTADIRILDESVSRVHAHLSLRDGQFVLEDAQSKNGTFVGGRRIETQALADEDIICLGGVTQLKLCFVDARQERVHRRLLAAAVRDPLTGVYNRLHFDERLAAECAAAGRHGRPLCLLMIDIDDFKPINDRFGHPFGDEVLRGVAGALQQAIRREDMLFRYGGEEFAVLSRETAMAGALRLANRLRERVAAAGFATGAAEPLRVEVSIGIAEFADGMTGRDLVARADGGLYRAKREGKNRAVAT